MRITSGSLKGRVIPFNPEKFNDADVTPSKIKEALFSILGENLGGRKLLDLFAGSGQIGLEALSRGAESVVFNDRDSRRVRFIGEMTRNWGVAERSVVLHMPETRCLRYLESKAMKFDIIFLDPPYIKKRGRVREYDALLEGITSHGLLNADAPVIVQHFSGNELPENPGGLNIDKTRVYGTSSLSVYREKRTSEG